MEDDHVNPSERQMNDVSAIKEVKCADCGTIVPAWIEDESTRCDGQPYIWADCEDGPCGTITGQDSIEAIHNENKDEDEYLDFINGNGWKWEAPSSYETGNFLKCELAFGYQCRLSTIEGNQPTKANHTLKMQIIKPESGDCVDLMSLTVSPWVDSYLGIDTLFINNVWPVLDSFPDIDELAKAHYVPLAREASEEATVLIRKLAADQSTLVKSILHSRAHLSHVMPCAGCGEICTDEEYDYLGDECIHCIRGDY